MRKPRILDIECYPNFYCFVFYWKGEYWVFYNFENKKVGRFAHTARNFKTSEVEAWSMPFKPWQLEKYLLDYHLFTYNGHRYDLQLCEHFLNDNHGVKALRKVNDMIINTRELLYKPYEYTIIHHTDMMKLMGFDGKQRRCSLKHLQFSMRYEKMKSLPYDPNKPLTWDQAVKVIDYCINDCGSTEKIVLDNQEKIESRFKFQKEYKVSSYSLSDNHLGVERLLYSVAKEAKVSVKSLRKLKSTYKQIDVGDVIFDYYNFNSPVLRGVMDRFADTTAYAQNGEFDFKDKGKFSVHFAGIEVGLGFGGCHACAKEGNYVPGSWLLKSVDVTSEYPMIGIKNNLAMAHLPQEAWIKAYYNLFLERQKWTKGTRQNTELKLSLNSAFGNSNNKYSPLYDPKYFLSITINGQLSILLLADMLLAEIPEGKLLMINTDGLEFGIPAHREADFNRIKSHWEKITKLMLEEVEYQRMFIRDVNNYISFSAAKTKRKGAFLIYEDYAKEGDFHKNPSATVIPNSIYQYISKDVPIADTIIHETNPHEFLYGLKVSSACRLTEVKSSKIVLADQFFNCKITEEEFRTKYARAGDDIKHKYNKEKVVRFYAEDTGVYLARNWDKHSFVSVLKNVRLRFLMDIPEKGALTRVMNRLNRDHYIHEADKITNKILANTVELG